MSIDARIAVLIAGIVLVLAAVVISAFIGFGKKIPVAAGKIQRAAIGLVGVALIVWVSVLSSRTPQEQQQAASVPGPTAAAADSAASTPDSSQDAPPPQPDVVFLAASALDSCVAPTEPAGPPDGATATRAQMLASHSSVTAFDASTNVYLGCLNSAADGFIRQYGRGLSQPSLRAVDALHTRINNSAVDVDQAVADRFNKQLHIFKARRGS